MARDQSNPLEAAKARLPWSKPMLVVYGDFSRLTRGTGTAGNDDGVGGGSASKN